MADEWGVAGKIKAVAFDYGKVISFPPGPETVDLTRLRELDSQYRGEQDRGVLSGVEFYKTLLEKAGKAPDEGLAKKMFDLDVAGWTRINPGTAALMEDLKAVGLKVAILSNMPHDFLKMARETFPVFKIPDVGIFSCEVGAIKPEEPIYEALFKALGCSPYEIVFVDDMRPNVEAARLLGMNAFVWKDPETTRELLKKMEIPV